MSSSINVFTVATFFSVKTETGLPTRVSFSIDSRPSLKRRTHLQTVAYFKAPFPLLFANQHEFLLAETRAVLESYNIPFVQRFFHPY